MEGLKLNKLIIRLIFVLLVFVGKGLYGAGNNGAGIGIIIGEPTGISFKYNNFPVIGIALSLENHFHLHCDYWMFNSSLKGDLYWFAGIGGKYIYDLNRSDKNPDKYEGKYGFGIRIPIGIRYYVVPALELFCEIVPGISVIPSTDFDGDAGIGIRYYFK